jgi:uncharacterized membrane protein YgcG
MKSIAIIVAAGALAVPVVAPLGAGAAVSPQYEGTVVSVDRAAHTFKLHDSQRGTVSIRVTPTTRFHRVSGFAGLRAGLTRIEATVKRSGGARVATLVERSGGGGSHGGGSHGGGGNGGGGADDGPNHG